MPRGWEYAGAIGNVYSFAHAKYPCLEHLFRDHLFCFLLYLGLSASRAPAEGAVKSVECNLFYHLSQTETAESTSGD